jgi:SAM-dependent methyltransferase
MESTTSPVTPRGQLKTRRQSAIWVQERDLPPLLRKVRPFTMVAEESLIELARQVRAVILQGIAGDFVECGVWRGGASFLMADILRQAGVCDRRVWLFDSFEGIPPPEEIDGPAALAWAKNADAPHYFDNLRAPLEQVRQSAAELGLAAYTECVKGWFDQTLPVNRTRIGPIAILRIDCDWYSGVRCCLEDLYDQVVEGGFVIFDDYYAYDGCARAVHEFLGQRGLCYRLESLVGQGGGVAALFRKGGATWQELSKDLAWLERRSAAVQELRALIPPGETLILVDGQELGGGEVVPGCHTLPFLERDGQYWGEPEDDATAVQEFERLRRSGASFLAFAWPAFWWLDYYAGFHRHLRNRSRCALENDRLIAFDLRREAATPEAEPPSSPRPVAGVPGAWCDFRRLTPVSNVFGHDRGRPIDRYFIEAFLGRHETDIRGRVLEVGDPGYTRQFGGERVTQSEVLHAAEGNPQATIVGDLATGLGIPRDAFDCIILTQTLQYIYDVKAAVASCHAALKPGGVVLVTLPGISQIARWDADRWGDYWRFTPQSAVRLFGDTFGSASVQVRSHGNVLVACAFLHGLADHELTEAELSYTDPDYPVLITVRAVRTG